MRQKRRFYCSFSRCVLVVPLTADDGLEPPVVGRFFAANLQLQSGPMDVIIVV